MKEITYLECAQKDLNNIDIKKNKNKKQNKIIDYSNVIINKPWGYEYIIYQSSKVAITILYIKKGHKTSMHCHINKKTSLIVLDGLINLKTLEKSYKLDYGKSVSIDKKKFHQSVAKTKDVILMEVETPNNKRDLYRLQDDYGRNKLGYEDIQNPENKENYNYIINESENTFHNKIKKFTNLSVGFYNFSNLKNILKKKFSKFEKIVILNGYIKINKNKFQIGDTLQLNIFNKKNIKIFLSKDIQSVITLKNYSKTKVSDYIVDYFKKNGITNFYGTIGNNILHLIDSIAKKEEIEIKLFSNAHIATMASIGFAKYSNKIPVVFLSSGKSALESIEAVVNAFLDKETIIVICGYSRNKTINKQIISNDKEIDISNLLQKFTNFSFKITKEEEIYQILNKIIIQSFKSKKGPIWVDVPIDILGKINTTDTKKNIIIHEKINKNNLTVKQNYKIKKIYDLIKKSKKPVFLFGNEANNFFVKKNIEAFSKKFKIPLLFSKRSIDILETKSIYNFGKPGVSGNRYSNFIIQKSDLIIGVGSHFTEDITGKDLSLFSPNSKKIFINSYDHSLKKKKFFDMKININPSIFLKKILDDKIIIKNFTNWISECENLKTKFSFKSENYSHAYNINPYIFINKLSKKIKTKSVIFYDGGLVSNYIQQGFEVKKNQKLITFSSINEGLALPASLGYYDDNFKRLICICGDNNVLEVMSEFGFFNELKTPVSIFCLTGIQNNYIRQIQNQFFGKRFIGTKIMGEIINKTQTNKFLKLNNLLKQMYFEYHEILKPKNLSNNINIILNDKKSNFCLVNIDKEHEIKPIVGFDLDFNGNWKQKPIDDMFPYLNRKNYKSIMDLND
jgi:acetolactate synthase I/II/III large subunit